MKKILILVLSVFLVARDVRADACATSLMPAFTAAQATAICTKFGTSVANSLIPQTDNAIDLGSTSKTWRTLYTGTSRIAKTSDILRVRQDANRLFTWDGSSDTALTMTFGDGGTTAVQQFTISASTADADDDSTLFLAGGGAVASDGTRGAYIQLPGEEVSGGSDITYNAGASDTHIFQTAGTQTMLISSAGLVTSAAGFTATTGPVTLSGASDIVASVGASTLSLQEAVGGTACMGTGTCNGATDVTLTTSCAKTGSRIFLQRSSADTDGVGQMFVKSISDATNFVVNCVTANDTSTFNWIIFHESP